MKKLSIVIVLLCFVYSQVFSFYLPVPQQEILTTQLKMPTQEYGKPKDMIDIVPHRPISAKDKYGNRLYFTPNGKLTLKITNDGTKVFSLSTKSLEYDKDNNLRNITEAKRGTNLVEIKNEKGEILGYQELGLGGKIIKEYDKNMNLLRSHKYDKFGKRSIFVLDEASQVKTVFDEKGRPIADINSEGTEVAWYIYDENCIIKQKINISNEKTYFDKKGRMLYTEDQFGNVLINYYYKKDEEGNEVLDHSVDYLGNVTYYKNNKPIVTKDKNNNVIKEYKWDGSTLVYEFNRTNNTVSWTDIDGKLLYISYDDTKVKEYLYNEGKLIGIWDYTNNSLSVIVNQQEVALVFLKEKPDTETVQKWLQNGLIKKEYTDNAPLNQKKYMNILTEPAISLYQPRDKVVVSKSKKKQVIGYYSQTDEFIPIEVNYFNKNGLLEKKENLISGRTQEFDTTGKLVRVYTKLSKEEIYEGKIQYNKDGSYTISYPGVIDEDANPNTTNDKKLISDAHTEHYSFDGRILEVVSKLVSSNKQEIAKQTFIYDVAGNLIKKQTKTVEDKILTETYYKHNLEQYTLMYVYNNKGELLGSYVASRNFYEGRKLIKQQTYQPVDISKNETKLISTAYFDEHSRISIVKDALDRIVQRYFYNDKNKEETVSLTIELTNNKQPINLDIKIAAGGILYKEEYTYIENEKQHTIRTYYNNGYEEYKSVSYLVE